MAMSPEQRAELEARAKRGDQEAFTALMREDERWIESIVWRTAGGLIRSGRVSPEDLIQAAWVGWLEAWRRYQPGRGASFRSFAWRYVQGRVIQATAEALGLSDRGRRAYPHVMKALASLRSRGIMSPSPEEILREIQQAYPQQTWITKEDVEEVLRALPEPLPIVPGGPQEANGQETIEEEMLGESPRFPLELVEQFENIRDILRPEIAWKFVVLCILRFGLQMTWDKIRSLCESNPPSEWKHQWEDIVRCAYPSALKCFPGLDNWDQVMQRFQQPPPKLTNAGLRQWFHRVSVALRNALSRSAD